VRTGIWQAHMIVMVLAAPVAFAQVMVVVKTEAGLVAGSGSEIHVWKGIPYAQPPTDDMRWKAPKPQVAQQGIRKALESGLYF